MIHNAPAVVYPIARSRFLGQLLFALWLAGLLATVAWLLTAQRLDWRLPIALCAVLAAGAAARFSWRNQPTGDLRWDGAVWLWESGSYQAGVTEQNIIILADFQSLMLLRLTNHAHAILWLWPEKRAFSARWLDLRRALYSIPKRPVTAHHDALPKEADDLASGIHSSIPGGLFAADSSKTDA